MTTSLPNTAIISYRHIERVGRRLQGIRASMCLLNRLPVLFLAVLLMFQASTGIASERWTLAKQENGISVYLRRQPASALKAFKGVVTIPTTLGSLVALLEDTSNYPAWLFNCTSAKTIRTIGKQQSWNYVVSDMPWPVADRDSVTHATLTQDPSTRQVRVKLQSAPTSVAKRPGLVRIERMHGYWLMTPKPGNQVEIVYEMVIDPGGSLPKWLVNTMVVDLPFYTLANLRERVKQPRYRNAKRDHIMD